MARHRQNKSVSFYILIYRESQELRIVWRVQERSTIASVECLQPMNAYDHSKKSQPASAPALPIARFGRSFGIVGLITVVLVALSVSLSPAAAVTCQDVRKLSAAEQEYWARRLRLTAAQRHQILATCYKSSPRSNQIGTR
jgi:hypothetical protein